MADGITRQDLDRIHSRLDQTLDTQTQLQVAVARIEQKIEMAPKPPTIPARPCPDFVSHIAEHKKAEEGKGERSLLQLVLSKIVVPLVGIIALTLGYMFGSGEKSPAKQAADQIAAHSTQGK